MQVINDFFLLIWKVEAKTLFSSRGEIYSFLKANHESNRELFCDYATIILSTTRSNIEELKEIKEAREAMSFLGGLDDWDKQSIQFLQKELLFFLVKQGDAKLGKEIQQKFDRLRKEDIMGYEKSRKLTSLIALIEEKKERIKPIHVAKTSKGSNFYESALSFFHNSIDNLKKSIEDETLLERLDEIPKRLKNQKFSIGITGVMNAGKSTMLNALLGKEILGTSVIPETANLTLIKYAKKPSAKVNFWDKNEWDAIEKSADTLESMKPFIDETKKHFEEKLSEYITDEGRTYEIDLSDLPSFTSAEHSDKKCNLVKSVELYTDLKFVENGVEIVDTPGLDDPVIQREEITKNYTSSCDLMIHLMHVNQSATAKDIEFIVDTLLYQSVVRLLVVITKIDTVEKNELEEVIAYTKSSIKAKLESLNKQNSLDGIIDKIDFLPIAALEALKHRVGRPGTSYPLEKTGILQLEEYLRKTLFGKNSQKANLIIEASKKELIYVIHASKDSLHVERSLLGKSASEIESEHEKYKQEIGDIREQIARLNEKIIDEKKELTNYLSTLKNFAKNRFLSLQAVVKRRVVDDFSYEVRKNSKKPESSRVSSIIETALKDGFVDLCRDYRYQFSKEIVNSFEKINRDFSDFSKESKQTSDTKEFFQKYFDSLNALNSNTIVVLKVNSAIKSHSKKDVEGLSVALDLIFEEALSEIYEKFNSKVEKINKELICRFEQECKAPIKKIKIKMSLNEKALRVAKKRVEDESFDTLKRLKSIESKLETLSKFEKNL